MSQQAVRQFFDAISQDQRFQGQLNSEIAKSAPEILMQIAKKNGYRFSMLDLKATLEIQTELTDQQLEAIAGGRAFEPKFTDSIGSPQFSESCTPVQL